MLFIETRGGDILLETPDVVIIKKCLSGEKEVFSELVTRYKKLIYNVIYNMIKNKDEVCDIAQEVFIRIYKSLDKYDPQYKFSTWSVKIATNYCLDVIRKKKFDTMPIDEVLGVSSDVDTPESSYIKREQSEKINDELSKLPEKYRVPLILYHKNGLSYEEMTQVLNEPMSIIKNRLFRARQMLKEKLSPQREEGIL